MSDNKSGLRPYAKLMYKSRTYKDKDGKEKGVWLQVGTLFSSPHGSNMTVKMDAIPAGNEWTGWLGVFKIEQSDNAEGNSDGGADVEL